LQAVGDLDELGRDCISISDQVNQYHDENGEQHGDGKEIAENFDPDFAAGHSGSLTPRRCAWLVGAGIAAVSAPRRPHAVQIKRFSASPKADLIRPYAGVHFD
jgi:hypothetical protein